MKELQGKILNHMYNKEYEEGRVPQYEDLLSIIDIKEHQLKIILKHMKEEGFIDYIQTFGGLLSIQLLSKGRNLVLDDSKFKKNFGFGVNLGIVNFNYGISEK